MAGAISIVGFALLAFKKIDSLKAIFDQMTIKPNGLPRNVKFTNPNSLGIPQTVSFDIDIVLKNPTTEDFAVTGYVAELTKVNIYYKNKFIGAANVNIDEISVPSRDTLILHNIPVQVQALNVLSNLTSFTNLNLNDLEFTGIINVSGSEYEIGN